VARDPEVFLLGPLAALGYGDAEAGRPFQQLHPQHAHQIGPSSRSTVPDGGKVGGESASVCVCVCVCVCEREREREREREIQEEEQGCRHPSI
jgi:hypothetical protein